MANGLASLQCKGWNDMLGVAPAHGCVSPEDGASSSIIVVAMIVTVVIILSLLLLWYILVLWYNVV